MFDYETLRLIWWGLLGVLLAGFAVLDGFDMGVAALMPLVAKNEIERRVVINTVGPVWEGNQVWLILGAGAVFAAWPYLYAVAFSGFYLAMFLVLFTLILRPVAFKFRSKMPNAIWRDFWDWCLFASGVVPPLVFGVAFGNALLGVPFTLDETMRITYTGGLSDLLNPFALLCGFVSLSMTLLQGATWLTLKTESDIETRARRISIKAGFAVLILFALAGIWVALGIEGYHLTSAVITDGPSNPLLKTVIRVAGGWTLNYHIIPFSMIVPALSVMGVAITMLAIKLRRPLLGFIGGSLVPISVIGTAGVSMFPFLLPSSTDPNSSLTVWDASSSGDTLMVMTIATIIMMPIIIAYTAWVYNVLKGKVTAEYVRENSGEVY